MLGLYFLAVLARHVGQKPALIAFAIGTIVLAGIAMGTSLHWPWYAVVGSVVTFLSGITLTFLAPHSQTPLDEDST